MFCIDLNNTRSFVVLQILLKDGTFVNLRSWNAERFPGQVVSLKRNIALKILTGPQNILHMSVRSTF